MSDELISTIANDQIINQAQAGDLIIAATKNNEIKKCTGCDSIYAFKLDNPSTVVPVGQVAAPFIGARLWHGDEEDERLFKSECGMILEIRDHSCLVYKNETDQLSSEEKPKIFLPSDLAHQLGFSRLASVGVVTQRNSNATFVIEKVASPNDCENATVIYLKDEMFKVQHISDEAYQPEPITPDDLDTSAFEVSPLLNTVRTFLGKIFSFKIFLFAIISRLVLEIARGSYEQISGEKITNWLRTAGSISRRTILDYVTHWSVQILR